MKLLAGVGATVLGSSVLAAMAGAAIFSVGAALIFNPIQKMISGERMTLKDTSKDVLVSGTIGAITGPMGGGLITRGVKAGVVSGAVIETSRAVSGEEVTVDSVVKSMALGAVVGAVGGASAKAANNLTKDVLSQTTKAVTRVGVQGASAAATDVGLQLYQTGEVDLKQTALHTTGQLVVSTTAEVSSLKAQKTTAYANKVNNQLIDENMAKDNLTNQEKQELKNQLRSLNSMDDVKPGGQSNAHVLEDRPNSKRAGQIAVDFGSKSEDGSRGGGRVITEKINGKQIYVDHTTEHDYKGCRGSIRGQMPNPIEGLKTFNIEGIIENCDDDEMSSEKEKKE